MLCRYRKEWLDDTCDMDALTRKQASRTVCLLSATRIEGFDCKGHAGATGSLEDGIRNLFSSNGINVE